MSTSEAASRFVIRRRTPGPNVGTINGRCEPAAPNTPLSATFVLQCPASFRVRTDEPAPVRKCSPLFGCAEAEHVAKFVKHHGIEIRLCCGRSCQMVEMPGRITVDRKRATPTGEATGFPACVDEVQELIVHCRSEER